MSISISIQFCLFLVLYQVFLFLTGLRNVTGFVIFMKDISKDSQFFLY